VELEQEQEQEPSRNRIDDSVIRLNVAITLMSACLTLSPYHTALNLM